MPDVNATSDDLEGYMRVHTNAPTRLTVSTFLAAICLSTFAVFLPNSINISGFDLEAILVLCAEILLGVASVFFLVVASVMSIILIRFGRFDFTTQKLLRKGTSTDLSAKEKNTLHDAIQLYDQVILVMYWGLIAVLVSLLFLGFHVHLIVGITIVIAFLMVAIRLRKFLRFMLFSWLGSRYE